MFFFFFIDVETSEFYVFFVVGRVSCVKERGVGGGGFGGGGVFGGVEGGVNGGFFCVWGGGGGGGVGIFFWGEGVWGGVVECMCDV